MMTIDNFRPGCKLHYGTRRALYGSAADGALREVTVPAIQDLREKLLRTDNQGTTNYCVSYAVAGLIEYVRWKQTGITATVDPLPIARRADEIDGVPRDGTTLETGLQSALELGLITPAEHAGFKGVSNLIEAQRAMHQYDVPILTGLAIDDGWLKARTNGWIADGQQELGGHAVLLCYAANLTLDGPPCIGFQNSWGEEHGHWGFNRLPLALAEDQFDYGLVWTAK